MKQYNWITRQTLRLDDALLHDFLDAHHRRLQSLWPNARPVETRVALLGRTRYLLDGQYPGLSGLPQADKGQVL